ncbi:eukaryotic aspartyl protease domain-containing protein [Ditylenchus destructor]|uniref:Eukaryotic aspartyl protease domain-containing protein n=1 Tax=Ditylenchus destructor TaxID=166010 RepID=A0AAD4MIT3_9BILA|nr:eukaryotic aspartyl protease domain-containing protein [Ditylenchus destructor]
MCLVLIFFCATDAVVHKFLARSYRLSSAEDVRHRSLSQLKSYQDTHQQGLDLIDADALKQGIKLDRNQDTSYIYIANVSIGSPAQTFAMEIDLWNIGDLCVIGSNFTISGTFYDPSRHRKQTYEQRNSSTFTGLAGSFQNHFCGSGHSGADLAKVDMRTANVSMGIVDKLSLYIESEPIDGILGLSPTSSFLSPNNLVTQLLGNLEKPIMTWWQNQTDYVGTAQVTLGAEDTDNCQSNYVYAPQVDVDVKFSNWKVHIASASIEGKPDSEASWSKHNFVAIHRIYQHFLSHRSIVRVHQCKRCSLRQHEEPLDCGLRFDKGKNVVFNIGGTGNMTDSSTKPLKLTGADYIKYYKYYDICYLSVYGSKYYTTVELPAQFMNNHCLAYNAKEKSIGFADAKWVNKDPKTYGK